jgi:hypothetical protein
MASMRLFEHAASLLSLLSPPPAPQVPTALPMPFELYHNVPQKIAAMQSYAYNPYREFNTWVNDIFFSYTVRGCCVPATGRCAVSNAVLLVPSPPTPPSSLQGLTAVSRLSYDKLGDVRGYYMSCYLRDFVLGSLVYWGTAAIWHLVIYRMMGDQLFTSKKRQFPTAETIIDQMKLAQSSLVVYAALPVLSEYFIESKMTRTYFYVYEVGGWGFYALYFALYIVLVEIGIYWMHRTLHTNKFLYKYVHGLHHKYNKAATLTPWASLAFNPLDGVLQVRWLDYSRCPTGWPSHCR